MMSCLVAAGHRKRRLPCNALCELGRQCSLLEACLRLLCLQLSQVDTQRVWQQSFDVWCDALRRKVKAVQVLHSLLLQPPLLRLPTVYLAYNGYFLHRQVKWKWMMMGDMRDTTLFTRQALVCQTVHSNAECCTAFAIMCYSMWFIIVHCCACQQMIHVYCHCSLV